MKYLPESAGEISGQAVEAKDFRPMASYDADGDCIEFFATNDNFYARRLDSLVTVYYDMATHEVIGALVKGVSKIFREIKKRAPGFIIEIQGDKVALECIFTACAWGQDAKPENLEFTVYRKLRRAAREHDIAVDARELLDIAA